MLPCFFTQASLKGQSLCHSLSNVGVESHESVLVHLEDRQFGERANAIREGLYEVLGEVEVCEVCETRQTLRHILKSVLTHVQTEQVLELPRLRREVGYLVVVQPEFL